MKQASRMYVRKHARPRDKRGQFLPGRQLWTRGEGENEETRWIRFLQPEEPSKLRSLSIDEDALRHVVVLVVVIVVAALLAAFVR